MLRRILGIGVVLAFIGWAVFVVLARSEPLPPLRISAATVSVYGALVLIVIVLNAAIVDLVARRAGKGISVREWIGLGCVATLMNYFLPLKAGMGLRLGYYARCAEHNVWRLSSALTAATLLSQLVFACVFLMALVSLGQLPGELLVVVLIAGGSLGLAVLFARRKRLSISSSGRVKEILEQLQDGLRLILLSGIASAVSIVVLSLLVLVFTAFRLGFGLEMLGQESPFLLAVVLSAAVSISGLVSLTVGGLGVREAAIVLAGQYLGLAPDACLMLALLDRVLVSLVVAILGLPLLSVVQQRFLMGASD